MNTVGRNEPCPCGSGKKYKACCLDREVAAETHRQRRVSGIKPALDWLYDTHDDAVRLAVTGDFFSALEGGVESLVDIPDGLWEMVDILLQEWLIAESRLKVPGASGRRRRVAAAELILGEGGPLLTAEQREQIEHMSRRAMSLYQVMSVRPGIGMDLRDLLFADEPTYIVRDVSMSRSLVRGDTLAARLLPFGDRWTVSGAVCTYTLPDREQALEEARVFIKDHRLTAEQARFETRQGQSVGRILRDVFLIGLAAPQGPPRIVDRHGDPVVLVNDHYDVLDWEALDRRLAATPEVEGDREDGWTWFEPSQEGDPFRRARLTLNVEPARNRLTAFAKSMRSADAGRSWLEACAGDTVKHRAREIADPTSPWAGERPQGGKPESDPLESLGPGERTEIFQQLYEQIYRNWADEPIPILGRRAPREVVATAEGRERVTRLLADYEAGELHKARAEGRPPANFQFLWDSVGLKRG